ncbi:MAG: hypothetical protein CMH48_00110 [Muricauda sp.]|jgi:hypothetical protein|nr:heavy metal-binding domain-containing protein [Allomuricauda sp.]MAU27423.1 hypothetical protein [Allomuricauda sp.]MBC29224.1 hypothetical protein [Allomuricauda sp.]|tara:strand:- start:294 stop:686 length:393 start_codon:yes stop_codon:yes gene_type:complete
MAIKRIFLHLLLLLVFVISCQDKKKENTEESTTDTELVASVEYQCPMDCEDGKTYHKEGSCPVCKMALKPLEHSANCKCTDAGECKCEKGACSCKDCQEHGKKITCNLHEDGNCDCDEGACNCDSCPVHS